MASPDVLFNIRNSFHLGAYQAAINAGADLTNLTDDEAVERDTLVFLSYIELGSHRLVIEEINSTAPTPLQAVKLLAMYLSGDKESAISSLQEWLSEAAIANNSVLRLIAGIIYMHEQDYNEALKHTHAGGTMELFCTHASKDTIRHCAGHALNVQIFLKMHRSDYAEKQLKLMQQVEEDHTLTQLAMAWLNLAVGGSRIQEAYLIFNDFADHYPTGLVLNGKAVCCIHMGRFDEAESLLLESLNKDAKDAETLANLIVCCLHLGKSSSRYLSQLKLSHPGHVLVKRLSDAEESFEMALQTIG